MRGIVGDGRSFGWARRTPQKLTPEPLNHAEKLQKERRALIDRRKAKRLAIYQQL
jgi:hypothetical protein